MLGPDWDSNAGKAVSVESISCLTPLYESPIWQGGVLNLPQKRLMTRAEYAIRPDAKTSDFDLGPCYMCYHVGGPEGASSIDAGHLWVEYDVTLTGTV